MAIFLPKGMQKIYNYVQIEKDKYLDDMYSIRNVSSLEIVALPEKTSF